MKRLLPRIALGFVIALLASMWLPYHLVAAPATRLRLVDGSAHPLSGIRVVREWHSSEHRKGANEVISDSNGVIEFPLETERISVFHRCAKPLLVFVPASCGPSHEIYGFAEHRVYWPPGYHLNFAGSEWTRTAQVWQHRDGFNIRDTAFTVDHRSGSHVELYLFTARPSFDYTLTLLKDP